MKQENGFTLIELLVAMAITAVVAAAIYSVYHTQQRTYLAQQEIVAMQQNLRAAMQLMEREIRMAGYGLNDGSGEGIEAANADSIRFVMDINDGSDNDADGIIDEYDEMGYGDGDTDDTGEDITYLRADPDGDGVYDLFRRDASAGADQILAKGVDALDLVYLDETGSVTADLKKIRSVQVTMVVRTARPDRGYKDSTIYVNQQGIVILPLQNDNFRRKLLTCEIKGRNLSL